MEKGEEGLGLDTSVGFLELLENGDGFINLDGNNNNNNKKKKMMKKKGLMCPQPQIPHSYPSPSTYRYSGRMLCFGGEDYGYVGGVKRSINRSETSSFTSSSTCTSSGVSKHKGKGECVDVMSNSTSGQKKPRKGQQSGSSNCGATKVKKEKLGERIMALQQLVSPFGKSDTSSVLHEALGYIKFLHDQVQVLSSPYLQQLPPSNTIPDGGGEAGMDLRSRGLCLVPISCTTHVVGSNGADLWSPVMESTNINHPHNT